MLRDPWGWSRWFGLATAGKTLSLAKEEKEEDDYSVESTTSLFIIFCTARRLRLGCERIEDEHSPRALPDSLPVQWNTQERRMSLFTSYIQSPSCDSSPHFYIHKENEENPPQFSPQFHHPSEVGKIPSPSIHDKFYSFTAWLGYPVRKKKIKKIMTISVLSCNRMIWKYNCKKEFRSAPSTFLTLKSDQKLSRYKK